MAEDEGLLSKAQDIIEAIQAKKNEAEAALQDALTETGGVLGRVLKPVVTFFSRMFENVWNGFLPIAQRIVDGFTDGSLKALFNTTAVDWSDAWNHWKDLGWLDSNDVAALDDLYNTMSAGKGIQKFFLTMSVFKSMTGAITTAIGGTALQRMNKSFSPSVPTPESIARVSFIAPELHGQVVDAMKRSGLSEQDIELLFISQYNQQSPMEIGMLYNRGEIDSAQADNRLAELGFTPARRIEIRKLWNLVPGIADIVTIMGREGFEPEMIRKFGLGAEYPQELTKWARMNGLSEDWAQKYWVAHWKDIGLQTMLEALHRGIQDWDEVYEFMKLVEIPPYFREVIKQISFNPLTRVDVRRIHDMGIIDDERLIKAYQDLGYDQENAEIMAEFTKEYNERSKRDLTKTDILKGYEDRDLDYNTAVFLLVRIGYKEDAAGYLVSNIDLEMERAVRLESIETTKIKYTSFLIAEATARNELTSSGLNQVRINELLSRWKALRISNTKHPSKTDLDKLFRAAIITDGEYTAQMAYIGYSEKYILWYKQLIQMGLEV